MRIHVFVDYWNLQLQMESLAAENGGQRLRLDWRLLPGAFVRHAAAALGAAEATVAGASVFASYDPYTESGERFLRWTRVSLARQSGVRVVCTPRRRRPPPACTTCHRPIERCPCAECAAPLEAKIEKGVDTALATEMVRLAWEGACDAAVLASNDSDFVPTVRLLESRGVPVVQARVPPRGAPLAAACRASFDAFARRAEYARAGTGRRARVA